MIELTSLPRYLAVHVIGSGPSANHGVHVPPGSLAIGINDAAYGLDARALIHFTMDLPYARRKDPHPGSLGVRVCAGEWRYTSWPMWIPHITGTHWVGEAAVSLALMANPDTLHLWGCDGGGGYPQARAAMLAELSAKDIKVIDHAI